MDKTSEGIIKAADEIDEVLANNAIPISNSHTIARLRFIANQMPYGSGYGSSKASELASLATIYYSERKHSNHPLGASGIYGRMRDMARRIRAEAAVYEKQGD